MQQQTFDYMLEEIFGAFGRQRPAFGSPAYRALNRRVTDRHIPDSAARFIATALGDYDTMPSNLGKAIAKEFANWLEAHPEKRQAPSCCPDCNPATPGFFLAWKPDGTSMLCICACNERSGLEGKMLGPISRHNALAYGLATEAVSAVVRQSPAVQARAQAALDSIGQMASQRPDHQAQLEEAMAW